MNTDNHVNLRNSLIGNIKKIITSKDSETTGVFNTNKGKIYFELSDSTPIITKYFVELILGDSLRGISFIHEIQNLEMHGNMNCKNDKSKNDVKDKFLEIDENISIETFFLIISLIRLEFVISNINSIYSEILSNPVVFGKVTKGGDLISQFENEIAVESVNILSISEIIRNHSIPSKWKKMYL